MYIAQVTVHLHIGKLGFFMTHIVILSHVVVPRESDTRFSINLSPVTRTRMPWRWGAAKDRRKLKGINRRYLRPPKSATTADDVIGTATKSWIHTHPTHLDQRPLRPPKLNNAVLVCSSFGGLRGLRACEGPLRLFVAVPMTISAAVADFGGRS